MLSTARIFGAPVIEPPGKALREPGIAGAGLAFGHVPLMGHVSTCAPSSRRNRSGEFAGSAKPPASGYAPNGAGARAANVASGLARASRGTPSLVEAAGTG